MGYELNSAQKAPVLNESGNPIATADVSVEGGPVPVTSGGATLQDDGAGFLEVVGNIPGAASFGISSSGTLVEHTITIDVAPFDWTLGTPVPK